MHIPNNPQLNMYHHTLQERQRLLQKHRLESYHASLHRREKEIMEDYHRRVEKMKELNNYFDILGIESKFSLVM